MMLVVFEKEGGISAHLFHSGAEDAVPETVEETMHDERARMLFCDHVEEEEATHTIDSFIKALYDKETDEKQRREVAEYEAELVAEMNEVLDFFVRVGRDRDTKKTDTLTAIHIGLERACLKSPNFFEFADGHAIVMGFVYRMIHQTDLPPEVISALSRIALDAGCKIRYQFDQPKKGLDR